MKFPMNILSLSGGKIEDGGLLYASAQILDDNQADQITDDRIDVGQKTAKVKISTANENQIVKALAKAGLIPGIVICEVETIVKKNEMVMNIVGFSDKAAV